MTQRDASMGHRGHIISHSERTGRTVTIVGIIVKMLGLAGWLDQSLPGACVTRRRLWCSIMWELLLR
jgi:hypothetical protein